MTTVLAAKVHLELMCEFGSLIVDLDTSAMTTGLAEQVLREVVGPALGLGSPTAPTLPPPARPAPAPSRRAPSGPKAGAAGPPDRRRELGSSTLAILAGVADHGGTWEGNVSSLADAYGTSTPHADIQAISRCHKVGLVTFTRRGPRTVTEVCLTRAGWDRIGRTPHAQNALGTLALTDPEPAAEEARPPMPDLGPIERRPLGPTRRRGCPVKYELDVEGHGPVTVTEHGRELLLAVLAGYRGEGDSVDGDTVNPATLARLEADGLVHRPFNHNLFLTTVGLRAAQLLEPRR